MRDLTNLDCAQLLNRLLDRSTMDEKRALLRAIDLLSPPRLAQPSPTAVVLDDERTEVEKFEKWWDKQRARAQEGNHLPRDIALSAWYARAASPQGKVKP